MTAEQKADRTGPGPEVKHCFFWMFPNWGSPHKAHKGFLITCGSVFNGHLAWFFKLFIASVVFLSSFFVNEYAKLFFKVA